MRDTIWSGSILGTYGPASQPLLAFARHLSCFGPFCLPFASSTSSSNDQSATGLVQKSVDLDGLSGIYQHCGMSICSVMVVGVGC